MELVIVWFLFGLVGAVAGSSRGRNGCLWGIIGILIGPFSLIVLLLPKVGDVGADPFAPHPSTHCRCPDCAELILHQARVCKHCGCKIKVDP